MSELKPRQIVAMGGGGFSMEPTHPLIDDHILALARVQLRPTGEAIETELPTRTSADWPLEAWLGVSSH